MASNLTAHACTHSCIAYCSYCAPMYIDIEKVEITKTADGEVQEATETYEKVFLAKVGVLNHNFCDVVDCKACSPML